MDFFRSIAEEKIQEAIRRGEFDNLSYAGKPLPPDDLDSVPEDLRMSYKILKNAGILPEELQLQKEMITLAELLKTCQDDGTRSKLQKELSVKKLRYESLMSQRGFLSSKAFSEYEHQIRRKLLEEK